VINRAEAIAGSVPGVVHAHARARWTGRSLRIEVEGWVDGALTTRDADDLGGQVAGQISRQLPEADTFTWIPRAAPV
jgi:divalent metal cation (Fe/Co/Zn/Cd) transporter